MQDDPETQFASLLASRLCHDLVNPAGALSTGLDVLATEDDPDMRQHADDLIKTSTARLLATIEYARLAYGASGGAEGELGTEDMRSIAQRLYEHLKPELIWSISVPAMPKRLARALLTLLLCAARLAPRKGASVTVEGSETGFSMIARGPRAKLPDDLAAVFSGAEALADPKGMPAVLAYRLAKASGLSVTAQAGEDEVVVRVG